MKTRRAVLDAQQLESRTLLAAAIRAVHPLHHLDRPDPPPAHHAFAQDLRSHAGDAASQSSFNLFLAAFADSVNGGLINGQDDTQGQHRTFTISGLPKGLQVPITFTFNVNAGTSAQTQSSSHPSFSPSIALSSVDYKVSLGSQSHSGVWEQVERGGVLDYTIGADPSGSFQLTVITSNGTLSPWFIAQASSTTSFEDASANSYLFLSLTGISSPEFSSDPQMQVTQQPASQFTLPDIDSNDGILTRLLLAESENPRFYPNSPTYNPTQVNEALQAMKATVVNRLQNNPSQFNAPADSSDFADIIGAPVQFQGFSLDAQGNIVIAPSIQNNINKIITLANSGNQQYINFINMVFQVVGDPVDDPFANITRIGGTSVTGGTYAWVTVGFPPPGGRYIAIPANMGGVVAGQQFYTLPK